MSERKQTFTDPKTGEEIESTVLARWGAGLIVGLVPGLLIGLSNGLAGLIVGLTVGLIFGPIAGRLLKRVDEVYFGLIVGSSLGLIGYLISGLHWGWLGALVMGLFGGLCCGAIGGLLGAFSKWAHDNIARQQHLRRQRLLKRKLLEEEWAGVPDSAISRAHPSGEPGPTSASLSRAEAPEEEPPRLAAGVDAVTGAEEQAITQQRG
jgi:hypothetical protein